MIYGHLIMLQQKNTKSFIMNLLIYQQRNVHNLIKDFKDEYIGYINSLKLVESLKKNTNSIYNFLPKKSALAFDEWKKITS